MWSGASSYPNLLACPNTAGAAVTAAGDDAGVAAAILAAVNSAIYGTPVAGAGADTMSFATAGKALVARTSGSVNLEFAVTSVSRSCCLLLLIVRCAGWAGVPAACPSLR